MHTPVTTTTAAPALAVYPEFCRNLVVGVIALRRLERGCRVEDEREEQAVSVVRGEALPLGVAPGEDGFGILGAVVALAPRGLHAEACRVQARYVVRHASVSTHFRRAWVGGVAEVANETRSAEGLVKLFDRERVAAAVELHLGLPLADPWPTTRLQELADLPPLPESFVRAHLWNGCPSHGRLARLLRSVDRSRGTSARPEHAEVPNPRSGIGTEVAGGHAAVSS